VDHFNAVTQASTFLNSKIESVAKEKHETSVCGCVSGKKVLSFVCHESL
jgi:hypothetical protein